MLQMYYELVINQRRTCNTANKSVPLVPVTWRQAVLDKLTTEGYDADGQAIA